MKINENGERYENSVFLGETYGKSTWRQELIERLKINLKKSFQIMLTQKKENEREILTAERNRD